jgi:hypothetical protein
MDILWMNLGYLDKSSLIAFEWIIDLLNVIVYLAQKCLDYEFIRVFNFQQSLQEIDSLVFVDERGLLRCCLMRQL